MTSLDEDVLGLDVVVSASLDNVQQVQLLGYFGDDGAYLTLLKLLTLQGSLR